MTEKDTPVDWQKCLSRASNDAEMAKTILTMFIKDLNDSFPKVQQAWEEEDYTELKAHIHKLYGGSCYTGIPNMTKILKELEFSLKDPKTAVIGPLLKLFVDEKEQLLNHFNSNKL